MTARYDVIVIGAGHNGLVAAAYLARAETSVLVLERAETVGGLVGTDTLGSAYRVPRCFPTMELFHPSIIDELRLTEHGLRVLRARSPVRVPTADDGGDVHVAYTGSGYRLDGAAGDESALHELDAFLAQLGGVLEPALTAPLPPVEPDGLTDAIDLLRLGWRLRKLGRDASLEAFRFLPMNVRDVLDERFHHPSLKAAIAIEALRAAWLGPRSPGSAFGLLHHRPPWREALLAPPVYAAGGPGNLTEALAGAARAAGATVQTNATVTRVRVADGAVRGVVVNDQDEIEASTVVSSLDPRHSLLGLPDPGWLGPDVVAAVDAIRSRGTVAVFRAALDGAPWRNGDDAPGRVLVGPTLDHLERSFDAVKYGAIPDQLLLDVTCPSLDDEQLAPPGHYVLTAWVQFVPHRPADGAWDAGRRDALMAAVCATLERHLPGIEDRMVDRDLLVSEDFASRCGVPNGCVYHVELALDQLLYMRPIPGWYGYRMPIDGYYLCGSGTHGGGGVTGLPGKNAAQCILRDLNSGK